MAVEQPERDPREIENVLMPIQEAFRESTEAGVAAARKQLRELTREEEGKDTDPELAAIVAEKLDLTPLDIPQELQNEWEKTLGEAFMYGGREGNDFLKRAGEKYSQVASRARERLPEDIETIPDDEKPRELSEFFHARDRQADVTLLTGDFEAAFSAYQVAIDSREKFRGQEPGPVACATYGKAAALFMRGEVNECLENIAEAKVFLQRVKSKENEEPLPTNIENLQTATMALDELDPDARDERLAAMKAILKQNGGKDGGVKRIDFNNLFADAEREAENLDI